MTEYEKAIEKELEKWKRVKDPDEVIQKLLLPVIDILHNDPSTVIDKNHTSQIKKYIQTKKYASDYLMEKKKEQEEYD